MKLSPPGTIKAAGNREAVTRWLPILRERKPEIMAALSEAANMPDLLTLEQRAALREAFEERAAILEYDAGLSQADAEQQARSEIRLERCTDCRHWQGRTPCGVGFRPSEVHALAHVCGYWIGRRPS